MNRYLQFGCGPHHLPDPWENYDREVDITRPIPFPDCSARFILAEHVIEHVPFSKGMHFLSECMRLLQPGGVLRLCFPDVVRIDTDSQVASYSRLLEKFGKRANSLEDVWLSILTDWGHESCWTYASALRALMALGFDTRMAVYGKSAEPKLRNIDSHHLSVGMELAAIETTVIEAIKCSYV